jgi:hypothetical protein
LTEAPRIKPTSPRCRSAWQPNPAEAPLIDAEILFRQSGPAQSICTDTCQSLTSGTAIALPLALMTWRVRIAP